MRFIHFADCHLDGYRDEKLARLGFDQFCHVIEQALKRQVDFLLLAGDLFNTALPRVDVLKQTVEELRRLQEASITVYAIPGSHDYSPRGKTMLDVLERAGLIVNVVKGRISDKGKLQLALTEDPKTGALITGILGKKGMLDKQYYEDLDRENLNRQLENKTGSFSIFMFHTALSELKPKELEKMDSAPMSFLPEGFNYYAGGHVHITSRYSTKNHTNVVYPGPTFPNSFAELEKLQAGTLVYYNNEKEFKTENGDSSHYIHETIPGKEVSAFTIDVTGSAFAVSKHVITILGKNELASKIVLLRLNGTLTEGKTSDIDFNEILKHCYDNGAYIVLKNTNKLQSKMFEEVAVNSDSTDSIEETTITEHLGSIELPEDIDEKTTIEQLLTILDQEQMDGEAKTAFVKRIQQDAKDAIETQNK